MALLDYYTAALIHKKQFTAGTISYTVRKFISMVPNLVADSLWSQDKSEGT